MEAHVDYKHLGRSGFWGSRLETKLDDEMPARLDEIWPEHKTAPEDHAW